MKRLSIFFFLLCMVYTGLSQIPAGYYSSAEGLTGSALKTALYDIIKGHTEYPYTDAGTDVWDIMKDTDEDTLNSDNVILLYTGWSVNAAQEYNDGNGWSREHVWAKSRGDFGTSRGPGTDAHHIRPSDISVNSARNNRWFVECYTQYIDGDGPTDSWTSYTDWYWKPRDEVKGDVARMIFYMATRYEGENGEPDLEVIDYIPADQYTNLPIHALLSDLLVWHEQDPVSDWERNRNDIIYYNYQHNRNPYIDHPEWVCEIFGSGCTIEDPASFTATGTNPTQIDLTWALNSNSDNVLLAWNTTNNFGTPTGSYSTGNTITGGGTVLYLGNGTSFNHTGLLQQSYYYKLWSYDAAFEYSPGVEIVATPLLPEPSNDPSDFIVSGTSSSTIDLSWTDATGTVLPSAYLIKASTGTITDPVDGTEETEETFVKHVSYGEETVSFTGLNLATTYYFKIYPYTNTGSLIDYKTDSPQSTSGSTDALFAGTIYEQDFDLNTSWAYTCDVTFFDNGWGDDGYLGIIDIAYASPLDYAGLSQNIFGEHDLDDEGNGTSGTLTLDFEDADISAYTNVVFGFDWDVVGYNATDDDARYELFYDGIGQGIVYLKEGNSSDPDGEGSVTVNVPDAVNTFDFKLYIDNNGLPGFSGYDNFKLEGETLSTLITWQGDDLTDPNDWQTPENWDTGIVPTASDNVNIPVTGNDPLIDDGLTTAVCNNLVIFSGASVTIGSDGQLTVNSALTNNSGASGVLIKSDASGTGSLIHSSTGVEAGCERYLTANNWHYIFSPLDNCDTTIFATTSGDDINPNFYRYNEGSIDYWDAVTTYGSSGWMRESESILNMQYAYAHQAPEDRVYILSGGYLNGGEKTFSLSYTDKGTGPVGENGVSTDWDDFEGWNLIGNPFTAAFDWDHIGIDKTNISNVIYYYDDQTDQYKYYGAGTAYNSGISINGGSQYVPVGQGFFVKATSDGNFSIPTVALVHNTQSFWKKSSDPINVLRLQINGNNYSDETVIRTVNGATNTFDPGFDALKMFPSNGKNPQLFSLTQEKDHLFALNSVYNTAGKKTVPLGLYIGISGEYELELKNSSFNYCHLWIEDVKSGQTVNLLNQSVFSFNAEKGIHDDQFYLHIDNNEAPVCNYIYNDQYVISGNEFYLDLPDDLFTDSDFEDELTYEFSISEKGENWLAFDREHMILSGTPELTGEYKLILKARDLFGSFAQLSLKINVSEDELSNFEKQFKLYPNPASDHITIQGINDGKYQIISVEGFVLKSGRLSENLNRIDVSELARGLYFIHVQSTDFNMTKIFIKSE